MAIVAIIKMIATTIKSSNSENPLFLLFNIDPLLTFIVFGSDIGPDPTAGPYVSANELTVRDYLTNCPDSTGCNCHLDTLHTGSQRQARCNIQTGRHWSKSDPRSRCNWFPMP